jgi:hypothetical protein
MSADVNRTGSIGPGGGRVRARLIGKALQPSCMRRIGTLSMGNQMRAYAALGEVHDVKPWYTRRQGEVSDADKVSAADAVVVSLQ